MKHAFLILAHNEWEILKTLVSCLDDERNDIYVHFDKKVKDVPELHCEKAGLHILEERVPVYWGDLSVVEAEYKLLEAAHRNKHYAYYHLLSGVDLPLKSQDYIHQFFKENEGKEFIGYTLTEITPEVVRKVQRWHLFPEDFKNLNIVKRILRALWIRAQEIVGYKRNKHIDFKKGSQWFSITDRLVEYVLEHKEWAISTFNHTFCPDELVVQTLCWMSPYKEKIYDLTDDGKGCVRCIGWKDGQLYDWEMKDLTKLKQSEALFARKFNSKDMKFIQKVVEHQKNES